MRASVPVILLLAGLCVRPAAAQTISLVVSSTSELRDGELWVDLEVQNLGDVTAFAVTPVLRFGERESHGGQQSGLEPSGRLQTSLRVPAPDTRAGRWPYQIAVDYTNAHHFAFQALEVKTVAVADPPPVSVAITRFESEAVRDRGELELELENLSEVERELELRFAVSRSLELEEPPARLVLAPGQRETVALRLRNLSADAGSHYPVFAIVEYEDGAFHQALVAHSSVEIVAGEFLLERYGGALWVAAGVLGVVYVGLVGLRALRRRAVG